ncbi:MAG TPA: TonB-dependent receptor [Thermoanaerobaculia bacterium]|nr:TonB-dependent receptor [Thermoanaerobaculia bacterium]
MTLAGRNGSGTISWSLAGNFQRSRERDLSNFDEWDYTYRNFDYRSFLRLSGGDAEAFVEIGGCDTPSAYWECVGDVPGQRTIELTSAGESLVRAIDLALVNENRTGFEEGAQNWSIYGKIRISNLTIGVEAWRSAEQVASAGLAAYLSGRTSWTPEATALYMKYSVPLERVKLNVFTRYEQTGVKRSSSRFDFLHHFISGYYNLFSFIPSCNPAEGADTSCLRTPVYLENVWFGTTSSQLRSEANVVYEPSEKLSGVAGVELAKSSIQTTYDVTAVGIDFDFFQPVEQVGHTDYALYAQGSYKLRPSLKAVLAGRLSHNRVSDKSDAGAYGILFTPRAGLIYSPLGRKLVLKAIYAEAFKDPTDYQRFGTLADVNDYPAEGLKPERVRNLELSAGWEPHRGLSLDASVYEARYSDVIAFGPVDDCGNNDPTDCLQYQNRDELRVRGLQMSGRYRRGPAEVWGHYTFTDPVQQNPRDVDGNPFFDESGRVLDEIPVADIASHHLAAGAEMTWDRWRFGLRAKHVGARRAGPGTTAPGNIHSEFAAHQTADVTFSYDTTPSTRLQVIVQNLFDAQYYDPGVEYKIHSSRVLQAGRAVYLRLILGLR